MAATAKAQNVAQRSVPPTPAALKERKLTLQQATDQWLECSLAIEGLRELQKQAATRLLEHAKKTGRRTYFDKIAVKSTGGSLVIDGDAVRAALPARRFVLGDLLKRQKRGLALERLTRG